MVATELSLIDHVSVYSAFAGNTVGVSCTDSPTSIALTVEENLMLVGSTPEPPLLPPTTVMR